MAALFTQISALEARRLHAHIASLYGVSCSPNWIKEWPYWQERSLLSLILRVNSMLKQVAHIPRQASRRCSHVAGNAAKTRKEKTKCLELCQ